MTSGKDQRRALTAAEQALRAVAAGDGEAATAAAKRAAALDAAGVYSGLPEAVARAVSDLEGGELSPEARRALRAAVGDGPLAALIED